jgi:hypothetical protein
MFTPLFFYLKKLVCKNKPLPLQKKQRMKIPRFKSDRLQNEEWFRFHTEFSELASRSDVAALRIELLFPPYRKLYGEADMLLELLHKSFITADMTACDRTRKQLFRSLRRSVKAYLYMTDSPEQRAAGKLHAVVRQYADHILKGTQAGQTAAIDNFLQDLRPGAGSIDLSQEAGLLGLTSWLTGLGKANESYKNAWTARVKEAAGRPAAGRLKVVRARMDQLYTAMIRTIEATLLVAGPAEGAKPLEFAGKLHPCITRYRALLKGRYTRSEEKNPQPTNP